MYACAYLDRSTYLIPGVADPPFRDESVHLIVVAISGYIAGSISTIFERYRL